MPARRGLIAAAIVAATLSGCSHSTSTGSQPLAVGQPPDLTAFLAQPVATPTSCPPGVPASASGARSPWVGRVDISIFLKLSASTGQLHDLDRLLRRDPLVDRVYFETQAQAYAEFQRLYTCWAAVPRSATPASYRVRLLPDVSFGQRNALVAKLLQQPGVDTASCDPAVPCVNVVTSASPQPSS